MPTAGQRETWFERNRRAEDLEVEGKQAEALELYEKNAREGCDVRFTYERMAAIYRERGAYSREVEALEQALSIERQRGPSPRLVQLEQRLETSKTFKEERRMRVAARTERASTRPPSFRTKPRKTTSKGCFSVVVFGLVLLGLGILYF